ncbi:transcription initiation factor TFIID subunit 11 [Bemisia tabaci]|uniref:transcription initiation factor TFIID subunit 11 n=1 Tax=Bemisia tabaci TaxID=7038 RepID=UPI003B28C208
MDPLESSMFMKHEESMHSEESNSIDIEDFADNQVKDEKSEEVELDFGELDCLNSDKNYPPTLDSHMTDILNAPSSSKPLKRGEHKSKKELEEEEREKMQVLVSNFTEEQLDRYEMYRRSAFPKAAIKRVSIE